MKWKELTKKEEVKIGTILKIVAKNPKDNYLKGVSVKDLVKSNLDTEVIINKEKNFFFNLDAYFDKRPMYGGWIKKIYIKND